MSMSTEASETERVDVYLPAEMHQAVEEQLDYGDSMSGYLREATRQRLARETGSDGTQE